MQSAWKREPTIPIRTLDTLCSWIRPELSRYHDYCGAIAEHFSDTRQVARPFLISFEGRRAQKVPQCLPTRQERP